MLISLIVAYFLLHGGSAAAFTTQLDALSSRVKTDVSVDTTRQKALAIVEQAQRANKAFLDDRKKYAEELGRVLGSRTSTLAQLDSVVTPFLAADSATTERMVDAYLALRPVLGAADWAKINAPPAPKPAK